MKFRLVVLLSLVLFLCTGCNWLRKNLGLMTSDEIRQLDALIASNDAKNKRIKGADSATLNLPSDTTNISDSSSIQQPKIDAEQKEQPNATSATNNGSVRQPTSTTTSTTKTTESKVLSNTTEPTNTSISSASNKPVPEQETNKVLSKENRYYIICGSFMEKINADKLYQKISELGGNPIKVEAKSGFVMVGVGGYATSEEAIKEINTWLNKGICSHDAWIYDAQKNNK